jgi:hypothetical protein
MVVVGEEQVYRRSVTDCFAIVSDSERAPLMAPRPTFRVVDHSDADIVDSDAFSLSLLFSVIRCQHGSCLGSYDNQACTSSLDEAQLETQVVSSTNYHGSALFKEI